MSNNLLTLSDCGRLCDKGRLGCYYIEDRDYELTSQEGKTCKIKKFHIYPVICFFEESQVGILSVTPYDAVAVSYYDPSFNFLDIELSPILN